MRLMLDSAESANYSLAIAHGYKPDFCAGYINGLYVTYPNLPIGPKPISISVTKAPAQVYDYERYDLQPSDYPACHAANPLHTGYASYDYWQEVKAVAAAHNLPLAPWWAAIPGAAELYPGSIATQYGQAYGCDLSVVADFWPGIDFQPITNGGNADMRVIRDTTTGREYLMGVGAVFWLETNDAVGEMLAATGQSTVEPISHATLTNFAHSNPAEPVGY